jgi:mono/diheme cytochrome c family protein
MPEPVRNLSAAAVIALSALALASMAAAAEPTVSFNRDIRPILADRCYQCHGPDEKQRQGDLRLDAPDGLTAKRESGFVIVPGKPDESELWRRITSADPDQHMPPADSGKKLSEREIATLRTWLLQGAKWEKHWSFLPVQRPPLADVRQPDWRRTAVDSFILARLEEEALAISPAADRHTILRRVTLDLTGLPPTPDEVAAFVADQPPDAYERAVDRLLASPRYGERMAASWLDAARYADTHGYQSDGERVMWRWRDWVIEALNLNMPFDQFTIEQLAGDLLPNATLDQRIATGFNRNHRGNSEGGIIPEEYAVEYIVDRVETTSTVWLGLTLGCARCHDHKFDPFSQRDFYSLYAFFNSVPENGRALKYGNSPPVIQSPTDLQAEQLAELQRRAEMAHSGWQRLEPEIAAAQAAWEKSVDASRPLDWQPDADLVAHFPLDRAAGESKPSQPTEALDGPCAFGDGIRGQAAEFDGHVAIAAGDLADFGFYDKFTLSAWVWIPEGGGGTIVSRMTDIPQGDGWQLAIVGGKLQLNLAKRWLDDGLRVESEAAVSTGGWHHVAVAYDGSRWARGVRMYLDGQPQPVKVQLDELYQPFAAKQPLRIGGGGGPAMRFRGKIDEVRLYGYDLSPEALRVLATPKSVPAILATAFAERTENDGRKLATYFIEQQSPEPIRAAYRAKVAAARDLRAFDERLPTTMVMEELPEPRPAHVLIRGQYDKPGEEVSRDVPGDLLALPQDARRNRLGLARWLVDRQNPLTARVAVNRAWQLYFGTGPVKSSEDFGRQGEWPTHPELLDWLATEFMETGWDVKRLHRLIVTSSTYRQSSAVTLELLARDPDNRLLARGPRLRLSAEMVRDQALAASGLLVEQVGGPSVKPLQPAGLWSELTGADDYVPGSGPDLVRRSLYTYWKRTIPPPSMSAFDASTREFCTVRQGRTNTPLQALALMNEELYVSAARGLALRAMRSESEPEKRITLAMQLLLGRDPTTEELKLLRGSLARHEERFAAAGPEAIKLLADDAAPEFAPAEQAAYTLVCATILNLDEAVTRQ